MDNDKEEENFKAIKRKKRNIWTRTRKKRTRRELARKKRHKGNDT